MKHFFKQDFKRMGHATKVARHADRSPRRRKGDVAIVLTAAYLHDIGIKEAEARYQSSEAKYQEELGPPIARDIMTKLGGPPPGSLMSLRTSSATIIIPGRKRRRISRSSTDADMIVNLEETNRDQKDPRKSWRA